MLCGLKFLKISFTFSSVYEFYHKCVCKYISTISKITNQTMLVIWFI